MQKKNEKLTTIWYDCANKTLNLESYSRSLFERLKPQFHGEEIEKEIEGNALSLFLHISRLKKKFIFLFHNFSAFESTDNRINDFIIQNALDQLAETGNNLIFTTGIGQNQFLKSYSPSVKHKFLQVFRNPQNLKEFLSANEINISKSEIDDLMEVTEGDYKLINDFVSLFQDIRKKYKIASISTLGIISYLKGDGEIGEFIEGNIVPNISTSEIELLKYISVFDYNENNIFIRSAVNDLIQYSFEETLTQLNNNELIDTDVEIFGLPVYLQKQEYQLTIKNLLYKSYFRQRLSKNDPDKYRNILSKIILYHQMIFDQSYELEQVEKLFYYHIKIQDYEVCYNLLNVFDHNSLINHPQLKSHKQDIYKFINQNIDLVDSKALNGNQRLTLQMIVIKITYEYFLWGIEEVKNLDECYSKLKKLISENATNQFINQYYCIVSIAYKKLFPNAQISLNEIEFMLSKILQSNIQIFSKDDIAYYQMLLADVNQMLGNNYAHNQLIKTATENASSNGVRGQIYGSLAMELRISDPKQSLEYYKMGLLDLIDAKFFSIAYSYAIKALSLIHDYQLLDKLEFFNDKKVELLIFKFKYDDEKEALFGKIYSNYKIDNFDICIRLCKKFFNEIDEGKEFDIELIANSYIIFFRSSIESGQEEQAKHLFKEKRITINSLSEIHILNDLFFKLILKNKEEHEYDFAISICQDFRSLDYYKLQKAKFHLLLGQPDNAIKEINEIDETSLNDSLKNDFEEVSSLKDRK